MAVPIEYEAPRPPKRTSTAFFWLLYAAVGLCSSWATDMILHIGRRPSDGGCFVIGMYALVPFAVVVLMIRLVIGRRRSVPAWTGAMAGVFVPPIALGLLIGTGVI